MNWKYRQAAAIAASKLRGAHAGFIKVGFTGAGLIDGGDLADASA